MGLDIVIKVSRIEKTVGAGNNDASFKDQLPRPLRRLLNSVYVGTMAVFCGRRVRRRWPLAASSRARTRKLLQMMILRYPTDRMDTPFVWQIFEFSFSLWMGHSGFRPSGSSLSLIFL